MGPARFHCAILLWHYSVSRARYMRSPFESYMFTLYTTQTSVMECQWTLLIFSLCKKVYRLHLPKKSILIIKYFRIPFRLSTYWNQIILHSYVMYTHYLCTFYLRHPSFDSRDHIVVSGRDNPGSNPGHGMFMNCAIRKLL